jgi:serine/threonine protein phosphatase PrpC
MLELRYSALSDTGLVRPANQDTAYAGTRVLAVADGFGSGGAPASSAAVEALKFLDSEPLPAGSVLNLLEDAVQGATQAVQEVAGPTNEIGTTLTAMVWTGSQLALVHIGDSRAYLLRDGGSRVGDVEGDLRQGTAHARQHIAVGLLPRREAVRLVLGDLSAAEPHHAVAAVPDRAGVRHRQPRGESRVEQCLAGLDHRRADGRPSSSTVISCGTVPTVPVSAPLV